MFYSEEDEKFTSIHSAMPDQDTGGADDDDDSTTPT